MQQTSGSPTAVPTTRPPNTYKPTGAPTTRQPTTPEPTPEPGPEYYAVADVLEEFKKATNEFEAYAGYRPWVTGTPYCPDTSSDLLEMSTGWLGLTCNAQDQVIGL